MKSDVHPIVATLVVLLAIATIGVWAWGRGEANSIGGPAEMLKDPSGHLFIQIQNQLLEHDTTGQFLKRHDLSALGVEHTMGGVGFFADGEILLRRGPDTRSLKDKVRTYQRIENDQSLEPATPDTGLYRCNLANSSCTLFGSTAIDFSATFGVFIDWRNDDVYISDTSRHVIRKYSADGQALSDPVSGFKFPNQLMLQNNQLLVANTNFHEITVVDPDTNAFGQKLDAFNVTPGVAVSAGHQWPSHFARVGNEWWVNNMESNMANGGIYIFDNEWRFNRKVALPRGTDPIALIAFNGYVLISDWSNDRIRRIDSTGEPMSDFGSPGFTKMIEESRSARFQYQAYSYTAIIFFALIFVVLIINGMTKESV